MPMAEIPIAMNSVLCYNTVTAGETGENPVRARRRKVP